MAYQRNTDQSDGIELNLVQPEATDQATGRVDAAAEWKHWLTGLTIGLLLYETLSGLEAEDNVFAEQVRKAIFTFGNIRERVSSRDVPRVQRDLDQADLVTVIAGAEGEDKETVDFILDNISQRLAENLRGEAAEKGTVPMKESEAAMMRIVNVIRELDGSGEIALIVEDEENT